MIIAVPSASLCAWCTTPISTRDTPPVRLIQSLLLRKCSGEAFFCRTDPTGLTDFCAIVLVVWERLCNFARRKVSVTGTSLVAREKALRTMTKKQAIQLFEERKMKKRDPELAKGWGQIVTPLSVQTAGGKQRVNCATI